jgi:hypothetical protein
MEFSEKMNIFFRGCATKCEKCNYNNGKICMHSANPCNRTDQVPYIMIGSFSRYIGGRVVQKNAGTVISQGGVNRVTGFMKFD